MGFALSHMKKLVLLLFITSSISTQFQNPEVPSLSGSAAGVLLRTAINALRDAEQYQKHHAPIGHATSVSDDGYILSRGGWASNSIQDCKTDVAGEPQTA